MFDSQIINNYNSILDIIFDPNSNEMDKKRNANHVENTRPLV